MRRTFDNAVQKKAIVLWRHPFLFKKEFKRSPFYENDSTEAIYL